MEQSWSSWGETTSQDSFSFTFERKTKKVRSYHCEGDHASRIVFHFTSKDKTKKVRSCLPWERPTVSQRQFFFLWKKNQKVRLMFTLRTTTSHGTKSFLWGETTSHRTVGKKIHTRKPFISLCRTTQIWVCLCLQCSFPINVYAFTFHRFSVTRLHMIDVNRFNSWSV